jgi:hypothetical protein
MNVALIVRGYRSPSAEEMARIAQALGCEIAELWPTHASQDQRAG